MPFIKKFRAGNESTVEILRSNWGFAQSTANRTDSPREMVITALCLLQRNTNRGIEDDVTISVPSADFDRILKALTEQKNCAPSLEAVHKANPSGSVDLHFG